MRVSLDSAERVPVSAPIRKLLPRVFRTTLECAFEHSFSLNVHFSISLAIVSSEEMKKLNNEHRGKNYATDVLSFPEHSPKYFRENVLTGSVFLGEVVLCYDEIVRNSNEHNVSILREIAFIFSHGILHVLGFRHGERMFSLQDKTVDTLLL